MEPMDWWNQQTGAEIITVPCGTCSGRGGGRSYRGTQHQVKLIRRSGRMGISQIKTACGNAGLRLEAAFGNAWRCSRAQSIWRMYRNQNSWILSRRKGSVV